MISNISSAEMRINYDLDPFHRTEAQKIVIATIPKITGGISFLSSAVMIYMILQSEIKLGTPFRRLIFAMCIVDLLQSGVALLSTLPSPVDTPGIWGAYGNEMTCSITGFIFFYASNAAPLYMCSLCIHYLCFVQYKVTQKAFRERIEPFLHIIPNAWCLMTTLFLAVQNYINQADVVCWIAPVPYNCINEPEIDCIYGKRSYSYRWIFAAGPNAVSLVTISFIMYKIYLVVKAHEKTLNNSNQGEERDDDRGSKNGRNDNNQSQSAFQSDPNKPPRGDKDHQEEGRSSEKKVQAVMKLRRSGIIKAPGNRPGNSTSIDLSVKSSHLNQVVEDEDEVDTNNIGCDNYPIYELKHQRMLDTNFSHRSREARKQAFLFVGSFSVCYTFVWINGTLENLNIEPPYILRLCLWLFFPLQGFFNVFIFTHPHVVTLMQKGEELTRWQALWKVIRSGGDVSRKLRPINTVMKRRSSLYWKVLNQRQQPQHVEDLMQSLPAPSMRTNTHPSLNNIRQHIYPKGPSTIRSRPLTHIRSNHGCNVSSLGIESFVDDESELSLFEFDEDLSMYGDNDYDIYDDNIFDDDRISFQEDLESQTNDFADNISYEKSRR